MLVNIFQINYWPFTDYPMFAPPKSIEKVSWFSLLCELSDERTVAIPVHGGAAVMKIYTEGIKNNDVSSLRSQMNKDIESYGVFRLTQVQTAPIRVVLRELRLKTVEGDVVPVPGREIFSFYLSDLVR